MSQCGYWRLQIDRVRSRGLIAITRACTEWADRGLAQCNSWLCKAWYGGAKWLCLIFANLVSVVLQIPLYVVWMVCSIFFPGRRKNDMIKHVFVVMLENRSFDHMLGLSNITGTDAVT